LFQISSKVFIYANYEINKVEIIKSFCINKTKPKAHCDGKCHLNKQLDQEDKNQNLPTNNLKEKFEVQICSQFQKNIINNNFITSKINFSPFLIKKPQSFSDSIFHPPSC